MVKLSRPTMFLLLLALALPLGAQQTITLRFVDYETGKPITKARVTATLWNGTIPWDGSVTPKIQTIVSKVSTKTDSDGMIKLPLPTPIPEHLEIVSSFDTIDPLDTHLTVKEVLETGMTVQVNADHSADWKAIPPASAGEVVIVTRKLTARNRWPE